MASHQEHSSLFLGTPVGHLAFGEMGGKGRECCGAFLRLVVYLFPVSATNRLDVPVLWQLKSLLGDRHEIVMELDVFLLRFNQLHVSPVSFRVLYELCLHNELSININLALLVLSASP